MNLNDKHKIYSIFAGIAGFFLLFGFLLLNQGLTIKRFSDEIENHWLPNIIAINAINTAVSDYRSTVALHVNANSLVERAEIEQNMLQFTDDIAQWQIKYEKNIVSESDRTLYEKTRNSYQSYLTAAKQAIAFSQNNELDKAATQFRNNRSLFTTLSNDLYKAVELNSAGSQYAAEQGGQVFAQAKLVILAGSATTIILLMGLCWLFNQTDLSRYEKAVGDGIRRKISLTFTVIILLFLVFGGLFYQQLARVNSQLMELNSNWMPSIIAVNALNTKISDYRVTEALLVMANTEDDLSLMTQRFTALTTLINELRNQYKVLISSDTERNLYEEFTVGFEEYQSASQQTLTLIQHKEIPKAGVQLKQNGILFSDFRSVIADLLDLNQQGGLQSSLTVNAALQTLKIITVGGSVFILFLLIISAQLIQSWLLDDLLAKSVGRSSGMALTIKMKLRMAFLGMVATVVLFSLLINGLMQTMDDKTTELEKNWVPSIIVINAINTLMFDYRIAESQHVLADSEAGKLIWDKKINRLLDKIAKSRRYYESLIMPEERNSYDNFSEKFEIYRNKSEKMLALSRKNNPAASADLQQNRIIFYAMSTDLRKLVDLNSYAGMDTAHISKFIFTEAQQTIFAVVLAIFMNAILFMIIFDKNISMALQRLTAQLLRLAEGDMDDEPRHFRERKDEIGQMADALAVVKQTLKTLTGDSIELIEAAQAGILTARVDEQRHPGEYGRILAGMNSLIRVLSEPLSEVAQLMQNLALGDLEGRMKGDYEGELRILKTNVNRSLDALVNLLTELGHSMQHMAQADLTQTLEGNYQGEFSVLKANINQSLEQLVAMLTQIIDSTSQSAVAITQTSESSKYVAEESARQLSAIEQVFKTLAETAQSVHQITLKAQESRALADANVSSAQVGQVQLNKLIELIQYIDAEYNRIEKITDEITRIADKTHLLSLNAGLEAMRAGDHGLGFGFVAQQIGLLAEEVSLSARDIGAVISSSGQKIRLGVHATQETQAAMEQIAKDALSSESNVEYISVAIEQQSAAVKRLTERLGEIRASSEASASASEEISTTMIHLAETVRETAMFAKRFKLIEK